MRAIIAILPILVLLAPAEARAELRGHGGPVRALAVAGEGGLAVSGSFDSRAIVWDLATNAAAQVLRLHEGSVNAVAFLPDGRIVTAGEDGRVAFWPHDGSEPERVDRAHTSQIVGLALSPDATRFATASWDATARIAPVDGGEARVLSGHRGQINAVAFAPDGAIVTAGYDATLRIWPEDGGPARVVQTGSPLNALAVAPDGEIVVGAADGHVRVLTREGTIRAQIEIQRLPVIALALSPDGERIAAATIRGSVSVIERATGEVAFVLVGPGLPVWSVAYTPDGRTLLTGGGDAVVRRWDAASGAHIGPVMMAGGADPLARFSGSRGAEVFRACAACHTLSENEGERAGPTLAGIFGRRIGTAEGYDFSPALREMDIVWTPRTVAELFEYGPTAYTPGSKMPEQRIPSAEDRRALVEFLEEATR